MSIDPLIIKAKTEAPDAYEAAKEAMEICFSSEIINGDTQNAMIQTERDLKSVLSERDWNDEDLSTLIMTMRESARKDTSLNMPASKSASIDFGLI